MQLHSVRMAVLPTNTIMEVLLTETFQTQFIHQTMCYWD